MPKTFSPWPRDEGPRSLYRVRDRRTMFVNPRESYDTGELVNLTEERAKQFGHVLTRVEALGEEVFIPEDPRAAQADADAKPEGEGGSDKPAGDAKSEAETRSDVKPEGEGATAPSGQGRRKTSSRNGK